MAGIALGQNLLQANQCVNCSYPNNIMVDHFTKLWLLVSWRSLKLQVKITTLSELVYSTRMIVNRYISLENLLRNSVSFAFGKLIAARYTAIGTAGKGIRCKPAKPVWVDASNVGSVCTAPPTLLGPRTLITHGLQRLMGCILSTMHCRFQYCWGLLHPFGHHCQHARSLTSHPNLFHLHFKEFLRIKPPLCSSVKCKCVLALSPYQWHLLRTS